MASIKPYFSYGQFSSDRDLITSTTTYSGVQKRYFSSLDAEIFIGGERILDIVRIDFSYEEKKMPYYGFNSFVPSKIFVGQKIVQGTFAINFTESGYIAKLLQKIDKSELANDFDMIGQACSAENAPLFGLQFDILVGYGGYNVKNETSLNSTYLVLQGVCVNGYQQILDISGEPVMETYSFIAKTIKFNGFEYPSLSSSSTSSGNISTDNGDDTDTNKIDMQLVEKRSTTDMKELIEKCNSNKNLLGLIVNVVNSLHVKDDESHIYVDFEQQLNSNKNNAVIGNVSLTISDNQVDIHNTYELKKTANTTGHYGVRINKADTEKIKKKLNGAQSVITCSIKFDYLLNGEIKSNYSTVVGMIKGLNY